MTWRRSGGARVAGGAKGGCRTFGERGERVMREVGRGEMREESTGSLRVVLGGGWVTLEGCSSCPGGLQCG